MIDVETDLSHHGKDGKTTPRLKADNLTVLGIVLITVVTSVSCTCPLLSLIAPAPTVTPTPTKTPRPSFTPTPTNTSTPTQTQSPTPTGTPTWTPTPSVTDTPTSTAVPPAPTRRPPTATPTRRPATATPRPPTATPTIAYRYRPHASVEYRPDCPRTTLEGTVWDFEPPDQLKGIWLKVCIEGEYWCATLITPTDPSQGDGFYDAVLGSDGPRAASWWVAVIDFDGSLLSERVYFQTDTRDCDPGGIGRQWVIIDFEKSY